MLFLELSEIQDELLMQGIDAGAKLSLEMKEEIVEVPIPPWVVTPQRIVWARMPLPVT